MILIFLFVDSLTRVFVVLRCYCSVLNFYLKHCSSSLRVSIFQFRFSIFHLFTIIDWRFLFCSYFLLISFTCALLHLWSWCDSKYARKFIYGLHLIASRPDFFCESFFSGVWCVCFVGCCYRHWFGERLSSQSKFEGIWYNWQNQIRDWKGVPRSCFLCRYCCFSSQRRCCSGIYIILSPTDFPLTNLIIIHGVCKSQAGGPFYPLYTGRRDGTLSFRDIATHQTSFTQCWSIWNPCIFRL